MRLLPRGPVLAWMARSFAVRFSHAGAPVPHWETVDEWFDVANSGCAVIVTASYGDRPPQPLTPAAWTRIATESRNSSRMLLAYCAASPAAHSAIHAAMNIDEGAPTAPAVRVLDRRRRASLRVGPGELRLEDGTSLSIIDRLPTDVPLGYHNFVPRCANEPVRLIVSPGRCHAPPRKPGWGWAVQLYSLRSAGSWGMGDLADLRKLAEWSKELGAGFVLVNPLQAVDPVLPQEASPYYPTSRRFRNPLYLRIEEVPGAAEIAAELAPLAAAGHGLNRESRISRDETFRLKQQALELIWRRFRGDAAFDAFRREIGPPLRQFATYSALVERFGPDWSRWDAVYRRPDAPGVGRFATENAHRVEYHEWLQWLLDEQLAAAAALPIVQDMPIGISPQGADAWTWQDVLADGVNVGIRQTCTTRRGKTGGHRLGRRAGCRLRVMSRSCKPFVLSCGTRADCASTT